MNIFFENRFLLFDDKIPMSIYRNKNFSYLAHWHTDIEIAYIEKGEFFVSINNNHQILTEGDIAIISSGDIHYYESKDDDSSILVLVFKPEIFEFSKIWIDQQKYIVPFVTKSDLGNAGLEDVKDFLYSILYEKQQQKAYYEIIIKSHIMELCTLLLRNLQICNTKEKIPVKNFTNQIRMQKILSYIEKYYTEDITLKDISQKLNLNLFNISKLFNQVTGTNFKDYINTLRILKAEALIKNSNKSLMDIAMECGFNNIRSFNRVFKNKTGKAPSSIRKEITKTLNDEVL